ncbi:MAG: IMP dehydrogenase [bacterium]|nr:IMP dehydrogenase [bacterium]
MLNNFPMGLTFDDVLLEPQESAVIRSEVDLSSFVTKKIKLQIPILAAAMDTVSEALMAIALGRLGGLAVLHRNCSVEEQLAMVRKVKKNKLLSSAAVGPGDLQRALALDKAGIDIIVVDTAHAHNLRALKSAKEIKKSVRAQIVVGNIGTKEAAMELVKFADAIKVGVGPGSICTTRVVAGIGVPQLTAILNVVEVAKKKGIPVIADGGIRYSGDAVKALAAGAQAVMLGSMLAGTKEAPGRVIKYNGELVKAYRGMGSFGAMQGGRSTDRYFQKNAKTYIPEGVEGITPYKGLVKDVVEQITGGMKSGMGYIGAKTIADMPKCARFIRITNAGLRESHPHTITINKKAPNY